VAVKCWGKIGKTVRRHSPDRPCYHAKLRTQPIWRIENGAKNLKASPRRFRLNNPALGGTFPEKASQSYGQKLSHFFSKALFSLTPWFPAWGTICHFHDLSSRLIQSFNLLYENVFSVNPYLTLSQDTPLHPTKKWAILWASGSGSTKKAHKCP
jgi:hypothetical protein